MHQKILEEYERSFESSTRSLEGIRVSKDVVQQLLHTVHGYNQNYIRESRNGKVYIYKTQELLDIVLIDFNNNILLASDGQFYKVGECKTFERVAVACDNDGADLFNIYAGDVVYNSVSKEYTWIENGNLPIRVYRPSEQVDRIPDLIHLGFAMSENDYRNIIEKHKLDKT